MKVNWFESSALKYPPVHDYIGPTTSIDMGLGYFRDWDGGMFVDQ